MTTKELRAENLQAGMYVVLNKVDEITRTGYMCTVMNQIGYCLDAPSSKQHYNLISIADGWTCTNKGIYWTKEELADYLNKEGYRMATKEEVLRAVEHLKKNYDN